MSIKETLKWGSEELILSSSSARLDAELLLAYSLGAPATFLLTHDQNSLGFFKLWRYRRLILKRKAGIPVAYLTGHKEFYFLDFKVTSACLVPRPDTEILAEAAIDYLLTLKNPLLLDVGTGSGCIAISALKNVPALTAIATDISRAALRVARWNARRHGVKDRIEFIHSDLLKNVPRDRFEGKDLVVTANLPYIPQDFAVNPETKFEPGLALYGGTDGVEVYKRLMEQLKLFCPRAIFVECFDFQKTILEQYLPGYRLKSIKPMTGLARMLFLERK